MKRGGETAPGLQVNTKPRRREERHGICLFISPPHMLYLLHHHSESAQWGIRWTLHQLSEDAGTSTSRAAYIDVQHRKGGLLEGFGWQRSSFGALLKASGIALIFLASVRSPRHDAEPRLKRKKEEEATMCQANFIWHSFNIINAATDTNWFVTVLALQSVLLLWGSLCYSLSLIPTCSAITSNHLC